MGTEEPTAKIRVDSSSNESVSTHCPSSRCISLTSTNPDDIDGTKSSNKVKFVGSDFGPLQDKYELASGSKGFKILGAGEFGKVYEGFRIEDGTKVAIKMLDQKKGKKETEYAQGLFDHEVQVLRRVAEHPHVLRCLDVVYSSGGAHALVTELCDGGDLWDYLDRRGGVCEKQARIWFGQLVDAVGYMHRNGVIHLDLKTENIGLVGNHTLKIMDFGFSQTCSVYSQTLEPVRFKKEFGTLACMAPEVAKQDYRGPEADIWGLGAVLYEMLTGRYPFNAETEREQRRLILKGWYCTGFAKFQTLTWQVRSLLRGLFRIEPEKRYTLHEVRQCAWLKNTMHKKTSTSYDSVWATMPQRLDIVDGRAPMSVEPIQSQPDSFDCTSGMVKLWRDVETWLEYKVNSMSLCGGAWS